MNIFFKLFPTCSNKIGVLVTKRIWIEMKWLKDEWMNEQNLKLMNERMKYNFKNYRNAHERCKIHICVQGLAGNIEMDSLQGQVG